MISKRIWLSQEDQNTKPESSNTSKLHINIKPKEKLKLLNWTLKEEDNLQISVQYKEEVIMTNLLLLLMLGHKSSEKENFQQLHLNTSMKSILLKKSLTWLGWNLLWENLFRRRTYNLLTSKETTLMRIETPKVTLKEPKMTTIM